MSGCSKPALSSASEFDEMLAAHGAVELNANSWRCGCGECFYALRRKSGITALKRHLQTKGHRRNTEAYRLALDEDFAQIPRRLERFVRAAGIHTIRSESYTVAGDYRFDCYASAEELRAFLAGITQKTVVDRKSGTERVVDAIPTESQRTLARESLAEHAAIRAGVRPWQEGWGEAVKQMLEREEL
jgi:hypothetical protein